MADEVKSNDTKKPSESSEKRTSKHTLAKVRKLFWIALGILIFLLLISIVALSTRMYQYAKLADDARVIAITADSVEHFDIFSAEYKNDSGEVIVKSHNGDPVIAPGTDTEYTIRIKNDDNVAVDYTFNPKVEYTGTLELPIEVRLISPNQEYLIGSAKSWGTFEDFNEIELSSTIPKGEVEEYELQWRWLFERGDDEGDTALGNAPEGSVGISVGMELHAEANLSAEANGGFFRVGVEEMLWLFIFFILLLIAIILLILSIIRRKTAEPEPIVVVAAPAPAPAPVPVPVPTPIASKKKNKGFVGKMEYVNIDTLVEVFNTGDTISLKILKEKGLVNPKATQVKILARNDMPLHKAFHIETQGISSQARQKVIAAGGTIKIIDG